MSLRKSGLEDRLLSVWVLPDSVLFDPEEPVPKAICVDALLDSPLVLIFGFEFGLMLFGFVLSGLCYLD